MNAHPEPGAAMPVPPAWAALAQEWTRLGQEWGAWWTRAVLPHAPKDASAPPSVPAALPVDPHAAMEITERYAAKLQSLWQAMAAAGGGTPPRLVEPKPGDRRFEAREWRELPWFAWLAQSYLVYADYLRELAAASTLPPEDRRRLAFMTRQFVDAIAPSNFAATNPEVLAEALRTEGASLVHGLANLVADAGRGRISMSDESAFEVGRNLAVTPGHVVFRNELIELIQYAPSTPTVFRRPLVIVPPCINKYYILDLQPSNSFVAHAVAEGHTVFMVSWRNIPPELGHLTWDDYLVDGVIAAIETTKAVTGSRTVNALGFCVGGTLLACALAVLAARKDRSVTSATFLTTMLDFADPGEIGVYVTPEFLAAREPALRSGQIMRGSELAGAFASLRANELVWNYVVRNYLKGRTPPPFDLLYWNGDSANLPGPMYGTYLAELYLGNRLTEPGALTMAGEAIDLGEVAMPVYLYASRDDHIVPWKSAWRSTTLLGSTDLTFVLGASGHIAGVVNPPGPKKRSHWVNELLPDDPDAWFARAEEVEGSWWPHWWGWLAPHGGPRVAAPATPGSRAFPPLDPAPGRYVLETAR
ncbi:MAG: class I poly(R)-hydroxyalkanoic acid synthase [Burkholderiales bacterium]|nr:class I poly(R)-hydroxyalkanoic acid synthase [Burkholderiales bacterium]MCE7875990.1 class I poly(R)-hydroxyalkanoic acid synthase [Betaproteobacteria bacterium PRO3]